MRDKPCLTSADIHKAMAARRAEAEKNNWSVAIAVVDDGGSPPQSPPDGRRRLDRPGRDPARPAPPR